MPSYLQTVSYEVCPETYWITGQCQVSDSIDNQNYQSDSSLSNLWPSSSNNSPESSTTWQSSSNNPPESSSNNPPESSTTWQSSSNNPPESSTTYQSESYPSEGISEAHRPSYLGFLAILFVIGMLSLCS